MSLGEQMHRLVDLRSFICELLSTNRHCKMLRDCNIYIHTILAKVLGHPLLMKGLTTLIISMSTNRTNTNSVSVYKTRIKDEMMIQSVWKNLTGL